MIDVVTTVLNAAVTYDLTDLATAKDELSIASGDTTNDAWIGRGISQVSRSVMTETNRVFAPELVQDLFSIPRNRSQRPHGASEIQLSRWPVLGIVSVIQTLPESGTTVVLVSGADFLLDADNGRLLRLNSDTGTLTSWEPLPLAVIYTAGYGGLVQETQSVPATPFKVTVSQFGAFSCDQAVSYASSAPLARVAASPAVGQYTVADGVYTFNASDFGQALSFAYCILDIPDDLVDFTLRIVTGRYSSRGRDPSLIQRDTIGIGTERYWFGSAPGQTGPFTPDIAGALDKYRVPVAA